MNLGQSQNIVNANLIFLPFLALSGIFIVSSHISFIVILSFILYPIVYGHLLETVMDLPKTSWFNLFKIHWANYLCVIIILALPVIILSYFYDGMNYIQKTVIKNLIGFFINCLAIYIWPLVFLRRQIKAPILLGINIISKNIRASWVGSRLHITQRM
jgi:hypothetical protein